MTIDHAQRHRGAVANTPKSADQAAADRDYRTARDWLAMIEAIGDELSDQAGRIARRRRMLLCGST